MLYLDIDYVAIRLISIKKALVNENFITTSELNEFTQFLQKEYNKRKLNIIVKALDSISNENFDIYGDVIQVSYDCVLDLDRLPQDILNVLYDNDIIVDFLIKTEENKIKKMKNAKQLVLK